LLTGVAWYAARDVGRQGRGHGSDGRNRVPLGRWLMDRDESLSTRAGGWVARVDQREPPADASGTTEGATDGCELSPGLGRGVCWRSDPCPTTAGRCAMHHAAPVGRGVPTFPVAEKSCKNFPVLYPI
jgi:hypothetical protein